LQIIEIANKRKNYFIFLLGVGKMLADWKKDIESLLARLADLRVSL
jgi:hypothetical protein